MGVKLQGSDKIGYADSVYIIFEGKCVKIFLGYDQCLNYTFDDIMKRAFENGYKNKDEDGTILLIAESPLSGKVYRYGNYGDFWTEIGTTTGYA